MSPDLERLIELQHAESAIADARTRIAAHPHRLAEADTKLNDAKNGVDAVKQRQKESQEARREVEKNAAVYQGRLTKFKDQLSAVKTNREYQAMQHEIAAAQTELGAAEEKVIERMVEADGLAVELKDAEARLGRAQKDVEADKCALASELSAAEADLTRATSRRDEIVRSTPAALIALFHQVARARKGVALGTATREGLCSVCHVRLRPPVFQKIRQNDSIVQCETCQRILYYVPPPPPVETPVVHQP